MCINIASPGASLVDWLANPANHSEHPRRVEVIETHLSWVFLTDRYAYKLKKPADFDFVDFRAPEARRKACRKEVTLNHRLAPGVYLGVEPITESKSGGYEWCGAGRPVDWVVKMVRLNGERRCDGMLAKRGTSPSDAEKLVELLTGFYRAASVADMPFAQHFEAMNAHVRANRGVLLDKCGPSLESTIKSIHADQLLFLQTHRAELLERFCAGRIVEGHGDLRPEHVYFTNPPIVIDCIEFSREYRMLDIADELAFFAVECETGGHPDFGTQVLSGCLHELEDTPTPQLLSFYRAYRGCVRAKVAAVRAAQLDGPRAQRELDRAIHYLHVAQRHRTNCRAPALIVVFGAIGTGKSTLAQRLSQHLGYELLSTDQTRRNKFGNNNTAARFGSGRYTDSERLAVYEELMMNAIRLLDERVPVVIDGSFQLEGAWVAIERLLHRVKVPALAVECTCPLQLAKQRVRDRIANGDGPSEAKPEMVTLGRREHVRPPIDVPHMKLTTAVGVDDLVECILARLKSP